MAGIPVPGEPTHDHLNTARDLAEYNSGTDITTIANHRVFDAFGRVRSETNSSVGCLFGFTARPYDADTALQNNLNRWYDPSVGRWLSEDPIGSDTGVGDLNLYCYVSNDPLSYLDPFGFAKLLCIYSNAKPGAPSPNTGHAAVVLFDNDNLNP